MKTIRDLLMELIRTAHEVTTAGNAQVFVKYSGDINVVSVWAYPADQAHDHDVEMTCLLSAWIKLNPPNLKQSNRDPVKELTEVIAAVSALPTQSKEHTA